jgi:hypothetical protein
VTDFLEAMTAAARGGRLEAIKPELSPQPSSVPVISDEEAERWFELSRNPPSTSSPVQTGPIPDDWDVDD